MTGWGWFFTSVLFGSWMALVINEVARWQQCRRAERELREAARDWYYGGSE